MSKVFRELEKAILQHLVLPLAYSFYSSGKVNPCKAVFADSKNNDIPYGLRSMYQEARKRGLECIDLCYNYETMSAWQKLRTSLSFMKQYATAKYVFICDYFLPVSSCRKRKETKVIQLWHASGLQKKFGYDADDDLKSLKLTDPVRNFDLVSVSADVMKPVIMKNWKLPAEKVQVLGSSRTDILFDETYLAACREKFYRLYPEARGKKVALWAPTFRGRGYEADVAGIEDIYSVRQLLDTEWFFIVKLHPNIRHDYDFAACDIHTEELYPVTDLLITDYSSVFYDYLLLKTKVIFFVPDYEEYKEKRGLYIEYAEEFSYPIVKDREDLLNAIKNFGRINDTRVPEYREKFIKMNNGNASGRILNFLEGEEANGADA